MLRYTLLFVIVVMHVEAEYNWAQIRHDLFTTGYRNGGSQVRIDDQPNRIMCLKACYVKKLKDDNTIDGVDYGVARKAHRCYCNRGAKTLVISSNWITSYIVENVYSGEKMCTGNFAEDNVDTAGNKQQRPPPGTACTSGCIMKSGKWGSSYCYTAADKSQWGAECIPCKAHPQCWDYYNKLTDKTRLTDGTLHGNDCDENTWSRMQSVDWIRPSWYRVMIGSGRIASSPKARASCKTWYPGWMRGKHPKVEDGIVKRDACFEIYTDECYLHAHKDEKIQVVNCGTYYLYYLPMAPTCSARYCVAA